MDFCKATPRGRGIPPRAPFFFSGPGDRTNRRARRIKEGSGAVQKNRIPGHNKPGVKGEVKVRVVLSQDGRDARPEAYRLLAKFFRRRERKAGEAG